MRGLNASDRARARIQHRGRTPNGDPLWTKREEDIVRQLHPDYREIGHKLRRRTRAAIYQRAELLKLNQKYVAWTARDLARLHRLWRDAPREQLTAAFPHRTWKSIQKKGQTFGVRRLPWVPKPTGKRTLDDLRRRAADLKISLVDLDRICAARHYFRSSASGRSPRRNVMFRAIAALGGRVEIVWK
jgi:hypothetical protein